MAIIDFHEYDAPRHGAGTHLHPASQYGNTIIYGPTLFIMLNAHEQLMEAMRALYLRMHRLMNDRMKAHGASLAQLKLLNFVERSIYVRAIDISDALGHTPRTVTEAVDALERDGLLMRTADPQDRRAKRISITKTGRDIVHAVDPFKDAFTIQLFDILTESDQQHMLRMLDILNLRLVEMGAPAPYGSDYTVSETASKSENLTQ